MSYQHRKLQNLQILAVLIGTGTIKFACDAPKTGSSIPTDYASL